MGIGVKSVIVALGVFAAVWTPSAIAQRGQGDGAAPARRAEGRQPARGGGGAAVAVEPRRRPRARFHASRTAAGSERLVEQPAHRRHGRPGCLDPKTREPLKFARMGEPLPDARPPRRRRQRTAHLRPPFTDWGLKEWKEYDPVKNGDYAGSCLPFGLSRNINSPHGVQIVHHPDALAFLFEQNTWHTWVPAARRLQVAGGPPRIVERHVEGALGRRHAHHRDVELQRLHEAGYVGTSAQQAVEADQHVPSSRRQHHGAHGDGERPKGVHSGWMNVRTWRIKPAPDVLMEYSCEENNLENLFRAITPWKRPENVD